MPRRLDARGLRRAMNLWPPFLFAGIRVHEIADDWSLARVALRPRWYNRNYVGTHFGGSLFAMTDPFWMLLALNRLGRDYIVWDQAAEIAFLKPGRGRVHAEFALDETTVQAMREATATGEKHLRWFETEVRDDDHAVVARVRKQLYVRRKPAR
ncbi:DUF4442 domain-containing protein [Vulcaniibacterium gelatinicum]|uniref:DUF4442 domain-containing protein n=1 Tax=Vulcaniibacterium gelatinicum TaxID=2598725 RepID=UPI001FECB060|nr:DUF4442 domain-containing protein [Vulcaniibacterium gelatinicum]